MKILVIAITSMLFLNASSDLMTPSEYNLVHTSNRKPIVVLETKRNMHKIHIIDEEKVKKIIQKNTGEDVEKLKLNHEGRCLCYEANTKSFNLKINAMSGNVMEKKRDD